MTFRWGSERKANPTKRGIYYTLFLAKAPGILRLGSAARRKAPRRARGTPPGTFGLGSPLGTHLQLGRLVGVFRPGRGHSSLGTYSISQLTWTWETWQGVLDSGRASACSWLQPFKELKHWKSSLDLAHSRNQHKPTAAPGCFFLTMPGVGC